MIPAIILAAGLSTRMGGRPKALLPLTKDETFVSRIVRTFRAAGVEEIVIVVGHEAARVRTSVEESGLAVRIIENPDYQSGQFSSVLAGLDAVDRPDVTAMLMTLVDIPLVAASTVAAVVERFAHTDAPIVRPVRGSEHGHPVLVSRRLFEALRRADPSTGAKPIVRAHVSAAGDVSVLDPGAFRDVDTPEQLADLSATFQV